MIIYGALFVQATEYILMEFEAVRGGLQYASLVRLSVSAVTVTCTTIVCNAFIYTTELTRHAVFNLKL